MPTPGERKALGFLVLIALSGSAVRLHRARVPPVPDRAVAALDRQLQRVDSARRDGRRPGRARTAAPKLAAQRAATPIDLDRAAAGDIEILPGIGPALAARIVAFRDSAGPFGSMDALCEVRGIGKTLATRLSPLVTFTAPRRPVSATCGEGSKASRKSGKTRTPEWR